MSQDAASEIWAVSKIVDVVDEVFTIHTWCLPLRSQTDRIHRTSLFTETAEDTAKNVDLVADRELFD
ncbi:hypothetical protein D3C87_2038550 [compost metagenome]